MHESIYLYLAGKDVHFDREHAMASMRCATGVSDDPELVTSAHHNDSLGIRRGKYEYWVEMDPECQCVSVYYTCREGALTAFEVAQAYQDKFPIPIIIIGGANHYCFVIPPQMTLEEYLRLVESRSFNGATLLNEKFDQAN